MIVEADEQYMRECIAAHKHVADSLKMYMTAKKVSVGIAYKVLQAVEPTDRNGEAWRKMAVRWHIPDAGSL